MKLLMENFKKYLNEIGDLSVEPYPFKFHKAFPKDGQYFYEFITDSGLHYYVGFDGVLGLQEDLPWNIVFDVDDSTEMTKENEPLKIMSTVVAVIKEFIATPEYHKGNLKFVFEGIPKTGSVDSTWVPTKRTNLYMRYLEKNMPPGTKVEQMGNVVKFEVPSENDEAGYSLVGNCVEFDPESGECDIPSLPYGDATQFAQAEENAKRITQEDFLAAVGSEIEVGDPHYLYDADNDVYMIHDWDEDIHHFYVRD